MIYAFVILILLWVISTELINKVSKKDKRIDRKFLNNILIYHFLLSLAYYIVAQFSRSDSRNYYRKIEMGFRGDSWLDFYGTSTTFVEWIGYPFVKYLGFTYEAMMVVFAFFGFVGFLSFYVFFRERILFKHSFMGYDVLTLFFFSSKLTFLVRLLWQGRYYFHGYRLILLWCK
ncbi:hypothetical protein LVD17_25480 [Fulvivirga ulvae]|uniref:hypothetical protein n=1 Tax=Fulvivirga ulvae TaxID=2904245 RepID=UPI001F467DED|nr:hypothetical protein [Fulvivirga ulvae]UII31647.1 hypothetical protein LVD17_25480 [Fulvivirga ulvae]